MYLYKKWKSKLIRKFVRKKCTHKVLPSPLLPLNNFYSTTKYNIDLVAGTDYSITIEMNEVPNGANIYTVNIGDDSDSFTFFSKDGSNIIEGAFTANNTGEYEVLVYLMCYNPMGFF